MIVPPLLFVQDGTEVIILLFTYHVDVCVCVHAVCCRTLKLEGDNTISDCACFVPWYATHGTWDTRSDPRGRLGRGLVISGQFGLCIIICFLLALKPFAC